MSPTHTNTPTTSVTGSVGGDWVQVNDQTKSRVGAQALEGGSRQELRPFGTSPEGFDAQNGHAVQPLKGGLLPSPLGTNQGSPERRIAKTSLGPRGSGSISPPRGTPEGSGGGGLGPFTPEPQQTMSGKPVLPFQETPEASEFQTPQKAPDPKGDPSAPTMLGREEEPPDPLMGMGQMSPERRFAGAASKAMPSKLVLPIQEAPESLEFQTPREAPGNDESSSTGTAMLEQEEELNDLTMGLIQKPETVIPCVHAEGWTQGMEKEEDVFFTSSSIRRAPVRPTSFVTTEPSIPGQSRAVPLQPVFPFQEAPESPGFQTPRKAPGNNKGESPSETAMLAQEEESPDPTMGTRKGVGSGISATGGVSSPVHCMSPGLPNYSSPYLVGTWEKTPTDAMHPEGLDGQKTIQKGETCVQLKPSDQSLQVSVNPFAAKVPDAELRNRERQVAQVTMQLELESTVLICKCEQAIQACHQLMKDRALARAQSNGSFAPESKQEQALRAELQSMMNEQKKVLQALSRLCDSVIGTAQTGEPLEVWMQEAADVVAPSAPFIPDSNTMGDEPSAVRLSPSSRLGPLSTPEEDEEDGGSLSLPVGRDCDEECKYTQHRTDPVGQSCFKLPRDAKHPQEPECLTSDWTKPSGVSRARDVSPAVEAPKTSPFWTLEGGGNFQGSPERRFAGHGSGAKGTGQVSPKKEALKGCEGERLYFSTSEGMDVGPPKLIPTPQEKQEAGGI